MQNLINILGKHNQKIYTMKQKNTQSTPAIKKQDIIKMIAKAKRENESIYSVSGRPDTRLLSFYKNISIKESPFMEGERKITRIDVTIGVNTKLLTDLGAELKKNMLQMVLVNDGHKRLDAYKIHITSYDDIEVKDKLSYSCHKSSAARIKKFVSEFQKPLIS